jgi:hypothetical protein
MSFDKGHKEKTSSLLTDYMKGISFDPMKFGNENELNIALTELRWIKKTRGKLRNSDFMAVSEKYKFPVDFLRRGFEGFSYPEDYLISKSKWFPILYSWVVRNHKHSINLYKLQFDYLQTRFRSVYFLGLLIVGFFYIDMILQAIFKLDLLQRLSLVFLPLILSFIALCVELRNNIGNKKMKLDEYSAYLDEMGLRYIILSNEEFIHQNYRRIVYASKTVLKKMQSSPLIMLFHIRTEEEEKQPTRFNKLLRKLHLLPKLSASIEKEKIPVFYGENAYFEYEKRIKELAKGT